MNKKKLKTILTRTGTGIMVFAGSLAGAYLITPGKTKKAMLNVPQNTPEEIGQEEPSAFSRFVNKLTADLGILEEETPSRNKTYYGMQAEFEELTLSFKKDSNSALNVIRIDGDVDFLMRGLSDINFNLNATVDYNSRTLPLEVGYVDKTMYLGLKDLRMKAGSTTVDELFGNEEEGTTGLIYQYLMASKEEGGINFNFIQFFEETYSNLIGGVLGGVDISNIGESISLSKIENDEEGMGLDVKEKETSEGWDFDITLQIHKMDETTSEMNINDINVVVSVDEDLNLSRVYIPGINIDNFSISGAINIDMVENLEVLAPDNEEYRHYNPAYTYVEVINYRGWLQKLANFLDEENQKFGFDFDLELATGTTEIGEIKGSINADFSDLIDLSKYQYVEESSTNPLGRKKNNLAIIDQIKSSVTFGIELGLFGQTGEEYGNLTIKYADGEGYINLNESIIGEQSTSVLKAKIDTETINWLMNELPGMVSSFTGETSSMDSLFSFISDSSLVSSINSGDYSAILDLLTTLRNDDDKIELGLDLSSLGLGETAEVNITLDSRVDDNHKVLNVGVNNLSVGPLEMGVQLNTTGFKDIQIKEEESYDSLSYLPTVFDQVSGILNTKQAGFAIDASLLDNANTGLRISGEGQFDYGERFGFGDLTIDQYKYENKGVWYSHKIALDVDNRSSDYSANNAYFVYGDPAGDDNIRGKVTVQSVLDIVDVFKTFLNENKDDPRFTKFIEPILKTLSFGGLADIINSKDYFKLLKNDLVKSMKKTGDNLDLTISGSMFALESDIVIRVILKDNKIDSLNVVDLGLSGKKLNLSITLKDFDENKESPIDSSKSYIDFSSISVLLKFGINTTKNNYYHLTADIDLNALLVINVDFHLDVSIVVKDEYVKIYGVIEDGKLSSIAQDYAPIVTKSVKCEFTFETYSDDDPNKVDGVGGYFHFKTTKDVALVGKTIKHYKTTSKNLLDGDNLLTYLLNDFLMFRSDITDKIGNIDLSSSSEKAPGEYTKALTSTGFTYNESKKTWNIGINLGALTGINALKSLELTIKGSQYENLSELDARLEVTALFATITVDATIKLDNPNPSILDWTTATENSFKAINDISFPASKLNNPISYISY